jgi:uncharacterized membrane protein YkoI
MSSDRLKMRLALATLFFALPVMLGVGVLLCPLHGARADEKIGQDEIRGAVRRGEIRSLSEIEDLVLGKLPGEAINVEIEREHDRWVYEFKVLDRQGRRVDVYVDAKTGDILETKTK